MIIEVPSLWQNKTYRIWLGGAIVVISLHLAMLYFLLRKEYNINSYTYPAAVMVEFSDPPQSIISIYDLPVGTPQIVTQDSQRDNLPAPISQQELPVPEVDELPLADKAEIVVAKKVNSVVETVKNKSEPEKKVENITKKKPVKSKVTKKKQVSDTDSKATGQITSAAPSGNNNKIAAEFNSSGNVSSEKASWQSLLMAHLQRYQRYPAQALKNQIKGKPIVTVEIDRDGSVLFVGLKHSSGSADLDDEAVSAVKRASPLPVPPTSIIGQKTNLKISFGVDFFINKKR
ncbi:energy transducer TonB [Gallibacterium salpingitidis]|uniref:energy transducer TonB n=1 Tax=Gallibacterium salpingitidis TaxID=505341 RepID=UPI00266F1F09|nr:energy transducer TonB [Gallibacterium salpingitidis]WKT00964.1 energy transducer TonB [Gallibacterium salpingitidis]